MENMQRIELLDTPRDLDQSPQINLTWQQKLTMLELDDTLGLSYGEGGFPESNPADRALYAFLKRHPEQFEQLKLAAFGMTKRKDSKVQEDVGLQALLESGAPALVIVGKSSRWQVENVLRTNNATNLEMIRETFRYLRDQGVDDLTFDAEHFFMGWAGNASLNVDADPSYALSALLAAKENGANRLVLCDTTGGIMPHEVHQIVQRVREAVGSNITLGVHMHNDGNMSTANSLAAVQAGATHVQGTWFGYGERVGNDDLTAIIGNLTRMGYECCNDPTQLFAIAQKIAQIMNIKIPKNTPFVGEDAYTHKAGMHTSGNARHKNANHMMLPSEVGNASKSILSKQAGISTVRDFISRLTTVNHHLISELSQPENIQKMLKLLKEKESTGISYKDAEISFLLLSLRELGLFHPRFERRKARVIDDFNAPAMASISLLVNGDSQETHSVGQGNGPVNALGNAYMQALNARFPATSALRLRHFHVDDLESSDAGTASVVQVIIEFEDSKTNEIFYTTGIGENIIFASENALMDAMHYQILKEENGVTENHPEATSISEVT